MDHWIVAHGSLDRCAWARCRLQWRYSAAQSAIAVIIGSVRMGQKPRGAERGTLSASCNGAERGTECDCGSLRSGSLAHGAERGPIG